MIYELSPMEDLLFKVAGIIGTLFTTTITLLWRATAADHARLIKEKEELEELNRQYVERIIELSGRVKTSFPPKTKP